MARRAIFWHVASHMYLRVKTYVYYRKLAKIPENEMLITENFIKYGKTLLAVLNFALVGAQVYLRSIY